MPKTADCTRRVPPSGLTSLAVCGSPALIDPPSDVERCGPRLV
jgi:hypothetical protein